MESAILKLVEIYCATILISKSPKYNAYHSIDHTKEVVAAVLEIGKGESISDEEMELVLVSAWFHDVGYVEKVAGHEEISAMFASNFLLENNFDSEKIKKVVEIILATKVPHQPKNHLEEIMCDADLHHFGKTSFETRNNLYRTESEYYRGKAITSSQFIRETIEFMNKHNFFTDYSKKFLEPEKQKNIELLKHQLESLQE